MLAPHPHCRRDSQPQRNRGAREGKEALRPRRRGAMTASLQAGGRAAGSGGSGRRTGSRWRAVSVRLCFRVGRSYLAEATCLSESRTGGRLCPPGWEVNVNAVCPLTPSLPSLLVRLLNKTQMATPSSHKSVNAPRICKCESYLR